MSARASRSPRREGVLGGEDLIANAAGRCGSRAVRLNCLMVEPVRSSGTG
jgi:hypothetical protein